MSALSDVRYRSKVFLNAQQHWEKMISPRDDDDAKGFFSHF